MMTGNKTVFTIAAVAILALAIGQVQAETVTVTVPKGAFHMFKPGTNYTVSAIFAPGNSWTTGMGDNAPINIQKPLTQQEK